MARSLEDWLDYIESIHPSSWELGLERVGAAADRLGLREPAPIRVIVAGTNGKGSTCVCLEQILIASGFTVGCTLSPHVHRFNERVRINGAELDDQRLCAAFEVIEAGRGDFQLTYFEFTALAALYCFKEAPVDVAVLEVGLGGRLDAFNIVDADVAVITHIGIDHTDWLGDTREQIGAEKAGVLRPDQTVILAADPPASVLAPATAMAHTLLRAELDMGCDHQPGGGWRLNFKHRTLADLPTPNLPIANCALAIAAADAVFGCSAALPAPPRAEGGERRQTETPPSAPEPLLSESAIRNGLARAWLPGRCEEFSAWGRRWLVDVAHNPLGAAYLGGELARRFPGKPIVALLGTLVDKDVAGLLDALDGIVRAWVLIDTPPPRGLEAAALAERCVGCETVIAGSVANGFAAARSLTKPGDVILTFGSFATAEAARLELLNAMDSPSSGSANRTHDE